MSKPATTRAKQSSSEYLGTTSDGVRVIKPPRGRGNLSEAQIRKIVSGLVEATKGQIEASEARRARLLQPLSQREREVIDLVVDGRSDSEAAHALGVSASDFEQVRTHIMARFGARDRGELIDVLIGQQPHAAE